MRALNTAEIDNLTESLTALVGCRLQEVVVGVTGVGMGFWTRGRGVAWLWFENHSWSPLLIPLTNVPEANQKPLRPLALFIRAHFVDQTLLSIERDVNLGRAMRLKFSANDHPREIEIHLWPHGGNFIASAEKRRVVWRKIEANAPPVAVGTLNHVNEPAIRSLQELINEWLALRDQRLDRGKTSKPGEAQLKQVAAEKKHANEIARIERAIKKVEEEVLHKQTGMWREVGDWLVANQTLNVPASYGPFIDGRRQLAWNIENCFTRGKELARKLVATEERLRHLRQELVAVQTMTADQYLKTPKEKKSAKQTPIKGGARFRTVVLPGGLSARLGRSATDNINLLKSARSWDLWLHLRDHPGSHAIVTREKQKIIGDEILRLVGVALVEQTFGNKSQQQRGGRFELIVAECRFVKPQRGDKKGRVNYSHDRTVAFKFT